MSSDSNIQPPTDPNVASTETTDNLIGEITTNLDTPPSPETTDTFQWGDGLQLEISPDRLQAMIEINFEHSSRYTPEDLSRFLSENQVTYGIDSEILGIIFSDSLFNQKVIVAKGVAAVSGSDGRVEWLADLSILDGAKLIEKAGRVDWKEQHHVLQVKKNQVLARLLDPTEGTSGKDISGADIPASVGKPVKLPMGKGTCLGEEGKALLAALDGVIYREGDKFGVSEVFNVQGDVNFKTGNVRSDTTVVISGGILSGFVVEAQRDIHVNGLVEGATLTAGGDIYLSGGVQGNEKAVIKAEGNITAKYVNNGVLDSNGDVIVNGAITNSVVRAMGKVTVVGNKAVILGGRTLAEHEIIASVIGAEMGTKTLVEIGFELNKLIVHKQEESKKLNALVENYKKLQQAVSALNQLRDKGKLNESQAELRLKMVRAGMQIQGQIKKIDDAIRQITIQIDTAKKRVKGITAKDRFWPGVTARILGNNYPIKTLVTKGIIAWTGNDIEVLAFTGEEKK